MKLIKERKKKRGINTEIQYHVKEAVIKFKIAKQNCLAIILNTLLKYQKGDSKIEYPIHVLINWINSMNITENSGEIEQEFTFKKQMEIFFEDNEYSINFKEKIQEFKRDKLKRLEARIKLHETELEVI